MATVTKDFRIKSGLVVEGTGGTINGSDIITEDAITGGTQTNISVTYNPTTKVVDFVAENGVADSTTSDLAEGTNLYYTNERVDDRVANLINGGTGITVTYDDNGNALGISAEFSEFTTDEITEGTENLFFTDARAIAAVGGSATSENTPDSVVKRDANGDFSAGDITANQFSVTSYSSIKPGIDIGGFGIKIEANAGDIDLILSEGSVKINDDVVATEIFATNAADDAQEAAEGYTDLLVGDNTIDGTSGNTVSERIATVASDLSDHESDTTTHGVSGNIVGTSDTQTLTNKTLDIGTKLSADLDADGKKVINLASPTAAYDAATKAYVDSTAQGLSVRPAVMSATTGNLSATYANGTGGVDATLTIAAQAILDIDGYTAWEVLDGVLVKDQTNAFENGRYYITQVGDAETDWILKRCVYCDEAQEIPSSYVFVQAGTLYGSTGWVATVENPGSFTVGQDDITWTQFSGAGTYLAGNGLELDGETFSIDTSVTVDVDTAQTLTNKSIDASNNTITNIANASLVNDSLTVNGGEVALGGSLTLDTDDVAEGSTNLYFLDSRAVDALEAVVPNFTAVEFNSIAKQIAATVETSGAANTVAYAFAKADYRTAKFLVKVAYGTHTEVSEVLLTLDTSDNIAITEYAVVGTNGSLSAISAVISGTDVHLMVEPGATATIVVVGTLLA